MKTIILAALIPAAHICGAEEIDFLTIIKNSPETSEALGIRKLNNDEQATLNGLLNRAYQLGAEHQAQPNNQVPAKPVQPGAARAVASPVFITKIDEDKNDVLKLANGAVVEITRGFLGFVGSERMQSFTRKAEAGKSGLKARRLLVAMSSRPPTIGLMEQESRFPSLRSKATARSLQPSVVLSMR